MGKEPFELILKVRHTVDEFFKPWDEVLERRRKDILDRQKDAYAMDVVVLLCAFLDSLANRVFWSWEGTRPQEELFGQLLEKFTQFGPRWNLISLPDLYAFLLWAYNWAMGLFISEIKLKPDVYALKKDLQSCGVDFEKEECIDRGERMIHKILCLTERLVRTEDRYLVSREEFNTLMTEMVGFRFRHVVQKHTLKSLFYRDYRCQSIHEWSLPVDAQSDKFWTGRQIYFVSYEPDPDIYGDVGEEKLLRVVFPIQFIWQTAFDVIQQLRKEFFDYLLENYNSFDKTAFDLGLVWDMVADAIARNEPFEN